MQFACFDFNYFSLRGQMASAGLKPWNNKWWMIYDTRRSICSGFGADAVAAVFLVRLF